MLVNYSTKEFGKIFSLTTIHRRSVSGRTLNTTPSTRVPLDSFLNETISSRGARPVRAMSIPVPTSPVANEGFCNLVLQVKRDAHEIKKFGLVGA